MSRSKFRSGFCAISRTLGGWGSVCVSLTVSGFVRVCWLDDKETVCLSVCQVVKNKRRIIQSITEGQFNEVQDNLPISQDDIRVPTHSTQSRKRERERKQERFLRPFFPLFSIRIDETNDRSIKNETDKAKTEPQPPVHPRATFIFHHVRLDHYGRHCPKGSKGRLVVLGTMA